MLQNVAFLQAPNKCVTFKCYFLQKESCRDTPFTSVSLHDIHHTAESTEAMQIKCLRQGHSILMLPGFEPSTSVSRKQHPNHMTKMLRKTCTRVNNVIYKYTQNYKPVLLKEDVWPMVAKFMLMKAFPSVKYPNICASVKNCLVSNGYMHKMYTETNQLTN